MTMSSDTASEGHGGASVTKRDFLFLTTGGLAAVGVATTIWPFIDQMNPDAATIAAAGPVDIDISQLQPGQRVVDAVGVAADVRRQARRAGARGIEKSKTPVSVARSELPEFAAAGLCRQLEPLDQAGNPGARRGVHPSRLHSRCSSRSPMRPIRRPTGRAASSAHATARNTIWRAGCSRAFPRLTTCRCRPITSPTTRRCGSARTHRARISTSIRFCRSSLRGSIFP